MIVSLVIALTFAQTATKDTFGDIPEAELDANAPNGFDITPDGVVWLNVQPVGAPADYAIKARDFLDRRLPAYSFWVRGYHLRDKSVTFRTSMRRVYLDCASAKYRTEYLIQYAADGKIAHEYQEQYAQRPLSPIVPGSVAAAWQRFACREK